MKDNKLQAIKDVFYFDLPLSNEHIKFLIETIEEQQNEIKKLETKIKIYDSAIEEDDKTKERYANEIKELKEEIKNYIIGFDNLPILD